jgi:hypothetical protein
MSESCSIEYRPENHGLSPILTTADTALLMARLFGADVAFWMNLQAQFDLETTEREMRRRIEGEVTPLAMAASGFIGGKSTLAGTLHELQTQSIESEHPA